MNGLTRVTAALALVAAAATAAQAQNYGMPLFTNPHYGSGMRIFADIGTSPDQINTALDASKTLQGGLGFSLGRFGLQALVAANYLSVSDCANNQNVTSCDDTYFSGAALAGLRVLGGGQKPFALAVFGGAGSDFTSADFGTGGTLPKIVSIPVGVSLGYKLGPVVLWGAPRMNYYKYANCSGTCPQDPQSEFRWAVGVNLPLGPLGLRAAYDGGQYFGENINFFGLGVSLGVGAQQ